MTQHPRPASRIFISVAEQSADEHAAALIRAFQRRQPDVLFHGFAGPAMRSAGCRCRFDMTANAAMGLSAVRRVPEGFRLLRRLKRDVKTWSLDAAVLVDSPAFNLPIAKIFRDRGIPVLYYIAPQSWAWGWRAWRNRRLRQRVDRLACLWPFEETYFREAGITATYVGHPTIDRLLDAEIDEKHVRRLHADALNVITLLPGSRSHVVDEVLPGQIEVAAALAKRFPRTRFLIVAANEDTRNQIEAFLRLHPLRAWLWRYDLSILSGPDDRAAAIQASDLALVASGTVTLEVAYHGTPMIVMYNTGRWPYLLFGRWLITTPHLSIPNILAGRKIVPEFMPYYRSTAPIIDQAVAWLSDREALARVGENLRETIRPILKPGAAENAADELATLLSHR